MQAKSWNIYPSFCQVIPVNPPGITHGWLLACFFLDGAILLWPFTPEVQLSSSTELKKKKKKKKKTLSVIFLKKKNKKKKYRKFQSLVFYLNTKINTKNTINAFKSLCHLLRIIWEFISYFGNLLIQPFHHQFQTHQLLQNLPIFPTRNFTISPLFLNKTNNLHNSRHNFIWTLMTLEGITTIVCMMLSTSKTHHPDHNMADRKNESQTTFTKLNI